MFLLYFILAPVGIKYNLKIGNAAERLSRKLGLIKKGMMITVRFYRTDAYDTITGMVARIDPECRYIAVVKTKIPFDDITNVSGAEISDGE